ncbi:MAG: aspartyl/asparaginyl beta-hydroxylase domain-containing protein [Phycisphaeraceae bacterium]
MTTAITSVQPRRPNPILQYTKKAVKRVGVVTLGVVFIPKVFLFYIICGLIDVSRNDNFNLKLLDRYFFGNGGFTWVLSPLNLFLDVLTFPYWNRGVYKKDDLPADCQAEIDRLIKTMYDRHIIEQVGQKMEGKKRGMIFFKWYGKNVDTTIEAPEFHEHYKYILTIGVSVFSSRQSTNEHFGPLRITLRVLYNLNETRSDDVYIVVGKTHHKWREEKLFIFDDTLMHQSVNQADDLRFCMFVDILRPSPIKPVLNAMVVGLRFLLASVNSIFYKKWTPIK